MSQAAQEALLDQLARIRSNRTYRLYHILAEDLSRIENLVRQLGDGNTECDDDQPTGATEQNTLPNATQRLRLQNIGTQTPQLDNLDGESGNISSCLQQLMADNISIIEKLSNQRTLLGTLQLEQEKIKIEIKELRHNTNMYSRYAHQPAPGPGYFRNPGVTSQTTCMNRRASTGGEGVNNDITLFKNVEPMRSAGTITDAGLTQKVQDSPTGTNQEADITTGTPEQATATNVNTSCPTIQPENKGTSAVDKYFVLPQVVSAITCVSVQLDKTAQMPIPPEAETKNGERIQFEDKANMFFEKPEQLRKGQGLVRVLFNSQNQTGRLIMWDTKTAQVFLQHDITTTIFVNRQITDRKSIDWKIPVGKDANDEEQTVFCIFKDPQIAEKFITEIKRIQTMMKLNEASATVPFSDGFSTTSSDSLQNITQQAHQNTSSKDTQPKELFGGFSFNSKPLVTPAGPETKPERAKPVKKPQEAEKPKASHFAGFSFTSPGVGASSYQSTKSREIVGISKDSPGSGLSFRSPAKQGAPVQPSKKTETNTEFSGAKMFSEAVSKDTTEAGDDEKGAAKGPDYSGFKFGTINQQMFSMGKGERFKFGGSCGFKFGTRNQPAFSFGEGGGFKFADSGGFKFGTRNQPAFSFGQGEGFKFDGSGVFKFGTGNQPAFSFGQGGGFKFGDSGGFKFGTSSATAPAISSAAAGASDLEESRTARSPLLSQLLDGQEVEGDDDDVMIIDEVLPSGELVKRAKDLQLPKSFYNYMTAKPCPGCIGCNSDDFDFGDIGRTKKATGLSGSPGWSGAGSKLFGGVKDTEGEDDDGDEDEAPTNDNIHFEPIVDLPPLQDTKTGEEGMEKLFSQRAKLYTWTDGTWKERGIGEIKVLRDPQSGKGRLLMRREQVLKLCCNHYITPQMKMDPLSTSETSWIWHALDYSESEPKHERFAIKFKTVELATQFKKKFEECKNPVAPSAPTDPMTTKIESLIVSQVTSSSGNQGNFTFSTQKSKGATGLQTKSLIIPKLATVTGDKGNPYYAAELQAAAEDYDDEEDQEEDVEDDDDDDDDEYEDEAMILYSKRAKMFYGQEGKWHNKGMGELMVIYEEDLAAFRVKMMLDNQDVVCSHIVCSEYNIMKDEKKKFCQWSAQDFSTDDPVRRQFKVQFSSAMAVSEFAEKFMEGVALAKQSQIYEKKDGFS